MNIANFRRFLLRQPFDAALPALLPGSRPPVAPRSAFPVLLFSMVVPVSTPGQLLLSATILLFLVAVLSPDLRETCRRLVFIFNVETPGKSLAQEKEVEKGAVCFAVSPVQENYDGKGPAGSPDLFRDLKVAVAEDDELNAFILSRMLTQCGAKVFLSRNGLELLYQVSHHQPNIIILDNHMELLDGEETLIRLKQQASTRKIPVILLTGDTREEVRETLQAAGAAAVLGKPVDFHALAGIIQTLRNPSAS